jgi:hypothetical protein
MKPGDLIRIKCDAISFSNSYYPTNSYYFDKKDIFIFVKFQDNEIVILSHQGLITISKGRALRWMCEVI